MPRITHLKEFEGGCWARLELDFATADGPIHVFTQREVNDMLKRERQKVWEEIQHATCRDSDEDYD